MNEQAKGAVIGLGAMGRHHVRVMHELENVQLVGVADISKEAVERNATQYRVPGFTDIEEMLDTTRPDLVSIVVPTSLHRDVTMMALNRGVHVLVEKPIAEAVAIATEMIDVARSRGLKMMVGHIERFNPAVLELKKRIAQAGTIFQVSARRMGPFPDRIRDVGVVVDLASHDIDAMNFILESPVEMVFAQTAQRIHATYEDMVVGTTRFANGTIGNLEVNWLTSTKIREMSVVGSAGTFVANYLTQDLRFFENASFSSEWRDFSELQTIAIGKSETYEFEKVEPLKAEISGFVDAVRYDRPVPASPESAANTLSIALSLIESARIGSPIKPELLSTTDTARRG